MVGITALRRPRSPLGSGVGRARRYETPSCTRPSTCRRRAYSRLVPPRRGATTPPERSELLGPISTARAAVGAATGAAGPHVFGWGFGGPTGVSADGTHVWVVNTEGDSV